MKVALERMRGANLGALTMILIVLNGAFALAIAILRNRIYDDYFGILLAVILLANIGVAALFLRRTPRLANAASRGEPDEAEREALQRRKKERRKKRRGR